MEKLITSSYKMKISRVTPRGGTDAMYNQNVISGISIDNDVFWGQRLLSVIDWISKRFPNCLIVIGDDLHRYNEMIFSGLQEKEALIEGRKLGDKMLKRVESIVEAKKMNNIKVTRWDGLSQLEEAKYTTNKIKSIFKTDESFRNEILISCESFLKRKSSRIPLKTTLEKATHLSAQYILEELAVFEYLITQGYTVQVYPGSNLPILKSIALGRYAEHQFELEKTILVDLKSTKK